MPDMQLIVRKT